MTLVEKPPAARSKFTPYTKSQKRPHKVPISDALVAEAIKRVVGGESVRIVATNLGVSVSGLRHRLALDYPEAYAARRASKQAHDAALLGEVRAGAPRTRENRGVFERAGITVRDLRRQIKPHGPGRHKTS